MNRSFGALIFVLILAGCGPSEYKPTPLPPVAPVTATELTMANIMPTKVGTTWSYNADTQAQPAGIAPAGTSLMEFAITDLKEGANGKTLTVEIKANGDLADRQTWLLNEKGLYQLSSGLKSVMFSPPQPLVLFPIKDGQDFNWKGTGLCPDGSAGQIESVTHVIGSQPVDLASGKASGVAIRTVSRYKHGKSSGLVDSTNWFAPDKGLIRIKQTIAVKKGAVVTTVVLKDVK